MCGSRTRVPGIADISLGREEVLSTRRPVSLLDVVSPREVGRVRLARGGFPSLSLGRGSVTSLLAASLLAIHFSISID